MTLLTPLNVEQSVSTYLADQLNTSGYEVYWQDTRSTQGSGSPTVTIVRNFPDEPENFVPRDQSARVGFVRVPVFSVFSEIPVTQPFRRLGLGEGKFDWDAEIRVEFITDDEKEWYTFATHIKDWFGDPDLRIEVLDYEADLTDSSPSSTEEYLQLTDVDIFRDYLGENSVLKYYINLRTTATIPR